MEASLPSLQQQLAAAIEYDAPDQPAALRVARGPLGILDIGATA